MVDGPEDAEDAVGPLAAASGALSVSEEVPSLLVLLLEDVLLEETATGALTAPAPVVDDFSPRRDLGPLALPVAVPLCFLVGFPLPLVDLLVFRRVRVPLAAVTGLRK